MKNKNALPAARTARNTARWLIAGLACALGGVASAQTTAGDETLYIPPSPPGREAGPEADGGFFEIGSANVIVSHLGYFSTNTIAQGGLKTSHPVGIFLKPGSSFSSANLVAQVTVPAGTAADYYTNSFYWVQLNPPVMLLANTSYYLVGQSYSNDGDWWHDQAVPTWNSYFIGTQATTTRSSTYGNGSSTFPPTSETPSNKNEMYGKPGMANLVLPNDPAYVALTSYSTQNLLAGATLTLTGFATGAATINYQWWQNGSALSGLTNQTATNTSLTIANVTNSNSGTYYLTATNGVGGSQSQSVTVNVYSYPVILGASPTNYGNTITLFSGASANFAVTSVMGLPTLSYLWYTNGVPDVSGTSTNYSVTNVQASLTSIACVVANSVGSATNTWTLSVISPPTAPYPAAVLANHPIGYWRLNESDNGSGNNGAIANDYWGGNFGIYSNTILNQPGYSDGLAAGYGNPSLATDTNTTSAQFGYYPTYPTTANYVANIPGINFATNANGEFSIEAWVKGDAVQSYAAAGIVAKGAWGAEQFTLDVGGTSYSYRFTTRAAGTSPIYIGSNTNLPDGNWHHLVGVLDQLNSNATFYVDGIAVASQPSPFTNGVLSTAVPVSIGARLTSGSSAYGQQFLGDINDVAIYNYALSSNQVVTHYLAAGIVPRFTLRPPSATTTNEGTTLTIPAQAIGSLPLNSQWYDITSGSPGTAIPGQTNPTLVIPDISAATYSNHTFALTVTNIYGQVTSAGVLVSVVAGVPKSVTVTPATPPTMYAGLTVVFTAMAQGAQPFYYQWSVDGSPVGVTTSTYTNTVAVGTHTIGCTVTNTFGIGTPSPATASVTGVAAPTDNYALKILADQPLAYWRLDEPLYASTAFDYVGGHDGNYYDVTNGLPGFSPSDPDTAAGFGMNGYTNYSLVQEQDYSGSGIPNIDFSQQGANGHFSIEAWVNAPPGQISGAGIVAKGYGGGGEQFCLDIYSSQFRFFVHNAQNPVGTIAAYSGIAPDSHWHHLVGVCDEANSLLSLYVDGALTATGAMVPGAGILGPMALPGGGPVVLTSIGSRLQNSTDIYSYLLQLSNAVVDEVAIYDYALSSNQVAAHYSVAALPAIITVQPSPVSLELYEGLSVAYSAKADGSPPLSYQWQQNGIALPGETTTALTFASIVSTNTGSYDLVVTNAGGAVTSSVVTLTVVAVPTAPYESLIVADSPLHYWRLDETNGTIAYDYAGGLNGTYGATTTLGEPGVSDPPFYGFPATNFSVAMDASDSTAGEGYVTAPALNLNTNTVTITAWVYPYADIEAYDGIVFVRSGTDVAGLIYTGLPTRPNTIGYTWNQGSSSTYNWGSGPATPVGQWSFVALVIEPTQTIAYVGNTNNGLLSATNVLANNAEAWGGTTLIGADTVSLPSRIFDGALDEIAVFDYSLSLDQITQLYSAATVPQSVTLTIQSSPPNVILTWPSGTLLQSPSVTGPWTTNNAASPYTNTPSGAGMFYRVRVQ